MPAKYIEPWTGELDLVSDIAGKTLSTIYRVDLFVHDNYRFHTLLTSVEIDVGKIRGRGRPSPCRSGNKLRNLLFPEMAIQLLCNDI